MKKLIIINGPPGVGKTTVSESLMNNLNHSCWLDGDWCWQMNPFIVNERNKIMVEDNIIYLLNNYLKNETFNYVIFSWVIPHDALLLKIIDQIIIDDDQIYKFSLICDESTLKDRLEKGTNGDSKIKDSINRLNAYQNMDTVKIDTTHLSVKETVEIIKGMIK